MRTDPIGFRALSPTLRRVLATGLLATGISFAGNIVATYEPAGVQTPSPSAICAGTTVCVIGTETFDSWHGGSFSTDFGTSDAIIGAYSGAFSSTQANEFGGVGGTGYYPNVFQETGPYSLNLSVNGVPGVNYFGLWFSALDPGNLLQFYENGTLVYSFTPADFITLVGDCTGSNAYCGNPNANFLGQNSDEQYAYLNFFDVGGYFNEVVFSEPTTTGGFESDNHTVAYLNPVLPSGTDIYATPEPGTFVLFVGALLALAALRRYLPSIRTSASR